MVKVSRFNAFVKAGSEPRAVARGEVRLGQSYMVTLFSWEPDLYRAILETDLDPFYDDKLLPGFLEYVEKHMPEYKAN